MKYIIKIIILTFPLLLIAQKSSSVRGQSSDMIEWTKLREKIEKAVDRGDITREDADKTYSRYRSRARGLKQVRRDPVIENHFKDLGVDDLNKLKNEMLDQGIPGDRLDAVLGGMLRLVHAARTDGENFKMNPRIEAYFKDRLGLANPQIEYLMGLATKIADLSY